MIPVNEPSIGEEELALIHEAVKSGWISSSGSYLSEFENKWARYCGRRHGIAVSNGTVALQLAVAALGIGPGDEVILPSFTIISCVLAVLYQGGTPVLVDVDPETWTAEPEQIASKVSDRTRAIMPVHIYGHPVNLDPILETAQQNDLFVIEDAAEAHGAECHVGGDWKRTGGFGHVSCFSFYANKIVTTGEGGMVLVDSDQLADRCRSLRNLGFQTHKRFLHDDLGFNFRMTNLQAAIGVAQVAKIDGTIDHKRWMASEYETRLSDLKGIQLPVERNWAKNVYWMYGVLIDEASGLSGEQFAAALASKGIETRPFFLGMHQQPALTKLGLFQGEQYPVTDRLSRQGIYLPSGNSLTIEQIESVCRAVREVMNG